MLPEVSHEEVALGRAILLVGQDADRAVFLEEILRAGSPETPPSVDGARNAGDARNALEGTGYDVVVVDLGAERAGPPSAADPGKRRDRLGLLEELRLAAGRVPIVVLVDPTDEIGLSFEAIHRGADDIVEKNGDLAPCLQRAILAASHRRAEADRLAQRVQDLELFTRTAAHDIQGPLRSMNLVVEMLIQGDDGRLRRDQVECLLALRNQVHKLDVLSDGLLQLATLGRDCLRLRPVPIDDVVAEVADLVGSGSDEYLHYGPMPTVLADRTLLVSLLHNLVDNGLKYVRNRAPNVWIRAVRDREMIRVEVTDNGIGIPDHQRERIFLPFVRGAAVSDSPGHGLGLAMCRRIAELHGGSIWVHESGNGGTTIAFTMPAG